MKNLFKKIFLGFYKVHLAKKYDLRIGKNVTINKSNSYGGYNALSKNALLISSHIGFASYIGERTVLRNVEIGKYTSIGPDVKCVFGKHPSSDFVSTHPAFFSVRGQSGFSYVSEQLFEEFEQPLDPNGKYQIRIGNDVWIGAGVSLMDGVSI
ncbi:MAG: antibiotic acetyltransferase, partial [Bacteroidota bacterium]